MTHRNVLGLFLVMLVCAGCGGGSSSKSGGGDGGDDGDGANNTGNASGVPSVDIDAGGAGGRDGGGGEGNVCDSITLRTSSTPPRVVFVQDLSSSMIGQWQPLDDAMVAIANDFGDRLQLGMIPFSSVYLDNYEDIASGTDDWFDDFFAARDNDCEISDSSIILPSLGNAETVIAAYDKVIEERMVGGTPTYLAMEKTREALIDQAPDDGSVGYAILVTDGEPNCPSSPTGDNLADVETAIAELAADGVNTYVVGYRYGGAVLDDWAAAGETGSYYDAQDSSELSTAISSILTELVPCDYALSDTVADPTRVRVTIDGEDRALNDAEDGWTLGEDRRTIELSGAACEELRSDGNHTISVVVECDVVVVGPE